jgi:hypothetical protein
VSPAYFSALAGIALLVLAVAVVPRLLLRRAQDRLAARLLAEGGGGYRLLTRADLVTGARRRLPGVLGLTADSVVFEGLFGEREIVALSRIARIITGRRLSTGRQLVRQEVPADRPNRRRRARSGPEPRVGRRLAQPSRPVGRRGAQGRDGHGDAGQEVVGP